MCENVQHIDRDINESRESYLSRVRARGEQWPCRMCDECARSNEGRIVGDFVAQSCVSDRNLMVLLTYNDEYLKAPKARRAGRLVTDRDSIPIAYEDRKRFVFNFRKMFRRLHRALAVTVMQCGVTEMAQLVDGSNGQVADRFGIRRFKPPRIDSPPRAHSHLSVWISIDWAPGEPPLGGRAGPSQKPVRLKALEFLQAELSLGELSQSERWRIEGRIAWLSTDKPVWHDWLIPRLRTDEWLYDHCWETKEEAKQAGRYHSKSSTPWDLGYISYGEPRGGTGHYMAKYCSKAMRLRAKYKQDKYQNWSAEELLDFQRSEQSFKSFTKSPGLGRDFYAEIGRKQAEAGLPPRLTFQSNLDVAAGGLYRRAVKVRGESYIDASGRLTADRVKKMVEPSFMLQRVGRQRALLEAYDVGRSVWYPDQPEPVAPNYRRKTRSDGREVMVIAYGLDEAREAIAKSDDERFLGKRDRRLGRQRFAQSPAFPPGGATPLERWVRRRQHARVLKRKARALAGFRMSEERLPPLEELTRLSARVSDELIFDPRPVRRTGEIPEDIFRQRDWKSRFPDEMPFSERLRNLRHRNGRVTRSHFMELVRGWEANFEAEVLAPARSDMAALQFWEFERDQYRYLYTSLRGCVALEAFSDGYVRRLAGTMRKRWRERVDTSLKDKKWPIWRKGQLKAGKVCG